VKKFESIRWPVRSGSSLRCDICLSS